MSVVSLLLLALTLPACDDGTGPGLPSSFDGAAIEASVDQLLTPIQAAAGPTAAVRDVFPALTSRGVVFDRQPGVSFPASLLRRPDVARTQLPDSLLGSTWVFNPQEQSWFPDPDRTDAPADAIRAIWYTTDAAGNFLLPLEERGYVDLTDEDTQTLSQLGVRMVEPGSPDLVLSDFTQGYSQTTDVNWVNHSEAAGFYTDGSATVDFALVSDGSGSDDTGDQQASLVINLTGDPATYTLDISATEVGASGDVEQLIIGRVVRQGVTTELDLTINQTDGVQTGEGTLTSGGDLVARIIVEGNTYRYRTPGGETLSSGASAEADNLVRTLFLAGITVIDRLPFLFP